MLSMKTAITKELFRCSANHASIQNYHGLSRSISSSISLRILMPVAGSFFEYGGGLFNLGHTVSVRGRNTSALH